MKYLLKDLPSEEIVNLANKLKAGSIAVIPTDTQYGIVTSAFNQNSVEKVYQLRKRSPEKPMIILISDLTDLEKFDIDLSEELIAKIKTLWPNPLSIIFPKENGFEYLHRGKKSLAFRIPKLNWLQDLLKISGPLVAPSANFEGELPATNIAEAQNYFGDQIDFYIDNGVQNNPPSTVIRFIDQKIEIIRQGVFKITQ